MKNTLMITASVAALVAAGGLASAQGMNEHREQHAAAAQAPAAQAPAAQAPAAQAPAAQAPAAQAPAAQAPAAQAPAALSTEHHAQIWATIRSENVAPLTDVHFSVTIGEAVPRTVHLNRLSPRIIVYAPQYRGYEYILVGDEILIVDPRTLRIVAVIPA